MSTSRLQQQVSQLLSLHLGQYTIKENLRPEWLEGLELDFYIEELNAAIEVQGQQHCEYIPFFHRSYDGFQAQLERDVKKKRLCSSNNTTLYFVYDQDTAKDVVSRLSASEVSFLPHPNFIRYARRIRSTCPSLTSLEEKKHLRILAKKRSMVKRWVKAIRKFRAIMEQSSGDMSGYERGIVNRKEQIRAHLDTICEREQVELFLEGL